MNDVDVKELPVHLILGAGAFCKIMMTERPKFDKSGEHVADIIGIDFAGPLQYKKLSKKFCILIFSCSLSRAVHLELLPNQTTDDFIKARKRFVARRARPELMFSGNAKTFIAAERWIKRVSNEDKSA